MCRCAVLIDHLRPSNNYTTVLCIILCSEYSLNNIVPPMLTLLQRHGARWWTQRRKKCSPSWRGPMGRDRASSGMSTGGYSSCKYPPYSTVFPRYSTYVRSMFLNSLCFFAEDVPNFSECVTARNISWATTCLRRERERALWYDMIWYECYQSNEHQYRTGRSDMVGRQK